MTPLDWLGLALAILMVLISLLLAWWLVWRNRGDGDGREPPNDG